jgi:epoxide hydrolase-like predicted phosphatase
MPHLQWKERFAVHYKDIDRQHQSLIAIINDLHDQIDERKVTADEVAPIFHRLTQYALTHFAYEERFMARSQYPGLSQHKVQHAFFIRKLLEMNDTYSGAEHQRLKDTLAFLMDWYINHILTVDMDYAASLRGLIHSTEIKAIVFDFGNVISRFDPARFFVNLAKVSGSSARDLAAAWSAHAELMRQFEDGQLTSAAFHVQACAALGITLEAAPFIAAFNDIFTPIPASEELIGQLKSFYKLGLLSNTNELHSAAVIRTSPVFPLFDAVALSHEIHAQKPDARIFDVVLDQLGLIAEECVYIDDSAENVAAAAALEFHAVHYTDHQHLLSDLASFKLKGLVPPVQP